MACHASVKQAIRSLTPAPRRRSGGRTNIRTNNIAPEALSPWLRGWMQADPEGTAAFIATIPMGRVGDCEQDIGRAVALLCSPGAGYISGATSGGWRPGEFRLASSPGLPSYPVGRPSVPACSNRS